jgi:hypothetical protein
MIDVDNKKSAVDMTNELSRRVMELGKERHLEPESSLAHLQLNHLPSLPPPLSFPPPQPRGKWQDGRDGRPPAASSNFM